MINYRKFYYIIRVLYLSVGTFVIHHWKRNDYCTCDVFCRKKLFSLRRTIFIPVDLSLKLDFITNILKENVQRDKEKQKNLRKKRIL